MSVQGGKDYLFLIWKSGESGKQYIVGQLAKNSQYEFKYYEEVREAIEDGFSPLLCFPDLDKVYKNERLFPVFASRLPDKKRKDIQSILKKYGMEQYDEYMLLKQSGARLPIDALQFIDPILSTDESLTRIFLAAGVRHYLKCDGIDCEKAIEITRGDEVFLKRDLENEHDKYAVQLLNYSGKVFGYIPRYYSKSVSKLLEQGRRIECYIYHVEKNKNCNECIKVIMKIEKQHA